MRMIVCHTLCRVAVRWCGAKPKPVEPPAPPPAKAAPQPDPCENRVIDPADNPDADSGAAVTNPSFRPLKASR